MKTEKNEIAKNFLDKNNFNKISKKTIFNEYKQRDFKNVYKKSEFFIYTGKNIKYLNLYEKK